MAETVFRLCIYKAHLAHTQREISVSKCNKENTIKCTDTKLRYLKSLENSYFILQLRAAVFGFFSDLDSSVLLHSD